MLNRALSAAPRAVAVTELQARLLDSLMQDASPARLRRRILGSYLSKITRLGGYLARAKNSPPGNAVIWRGVSRLTNIELGFPTGAQLVGN
jgi:hypothetical protein